MGLRNKRARELGKGGWRLKLNNWVRKRYVSIYARERSGYFNSIQNFYNIIYSHLDLTL